jgi:tubby-related protein 1
MNPAQAVTDNTLRRELCCIDFSYDKMGPGKIVCAIPDIVETGVAQVWKPREESGKIQAAMESNKKERLIYLHNKRPKWDEQAQGHVLNFHGRVTKSSVKNFQMTSDITGDQTILQFGRVDNNKFTMDFAYPLNPLQAFGICLSTLDDKLADSKGWENLTEFFKK